jgi:hypothetical protein
MTSLLIVALFYGFVVLVFAQGNRHGRRNLIIDLRSKAHRGEDIAAWLEEQL